MESPVFLAPAVEERRLECRYCHNRATTDMPAGWYQISVMVPRHMAERGYRWLGTFCSLACLALHMPEMAAQDKTTVYRRDLGERAKNEDAGPTG